MPFVYPLLHFQCAVCSYYPVVLIFINNMLCLAQEDCSSFHDIKHNFRYAAHSCLMSIIYPGLCVQCAVCSYHPIMHILRNNILYCMQECNSFRDVKHNFRYHSVLAVYLSLPSVCKCYLFLSSNFAHFPNVSCCVQEYSGCRVVKHNFRYRVSISTCFFSVICAPSCNRCILITPVPGARAPCTSPSPFSSSIEPRGMHQRGAPPPPPP